jgi:hypothetical protein
VDAFLHNDYDMFKRLINSQKTVNISSKEGRQTFLSAILLWTNKFLAFGSFIESYLGIYELGRLTGYIFGVDAVDLTFMDSFSGCAKIAFYMGLLEIAPNHEVLNKHVYGLVESMEEFFEDSTEYCCCCAVILRLIKLNQRDRLSYLLEILPKFCCFKSKCDDTRIKSKMRKCLQRILEAEIELKPSVSLDDCYEVIAACVEIGQDEQLFLSIIIDRWSQLSEAARYLIASRPDLPQELLIKVCLTGYSKDLLIRAVDSIVFRAQGLRAFQALQAMSVEDSVRVRISAHWFFVDDFEDISKYHSISAFLSLC